MDKVKILVVEDEIVIADNICDTLEDLGYEVSLRPLERRRTVYRLLAEQAFIGDLAGANPVDCNDVALAERFL